MTEFKNKVEKQRILLAVEAWREKIKSLHAHSLTSMWYENDPSEASKGVMDVTFNDNSIQRTLKSGEKVWIIPRPPIEDVIDLYERFEAGMNPEKAIWV